MPYRPPRIRPLWPPSVLGLLGRLLVGPAALALAAGLAAGAAPASALAAGRSNSLVLTTTSGPGAGGSAEDRQQQPGESGGGSPTTTPPGSPGSHPPDSPPPAPSLSASTSRVATRSGVVVQSTSGSARPSGLVTHRSGSPPPSRPPGTGSGGSGTPGTPTPSEGMTAQEQRMLQLVNEARVANGVPPVEANATLTQMARLKGQDILQKGYWGHVSPTYGSPSDMARAAGLQFWWIGENLVKAGSVDQAFQALMGSSPHRANILYPYHTQVGIGVLEYQRWGQQRVLVVQEFLTPAPPGR